jgi:transketolase
MITRLERANAIRALTMDAVEAAGSGHPGMPLGMAEIAEVLWHDFLHHNPGNPHWVNRDRFVLSNGHGAMLQYALLHLTGYDISIEAIKRFRQLDSKTPGHPELNCVPGVEATTGPLGQGLANGVGMALAEKILASQFNQQGFDIIDHFTYAFVGDGCLMEGISHEVCSLAGVWNLGKLIVFWDNNGISIDGEVKDWFLDDTPMRFKAYGWHVVPDVDGYDSEAVKMAILEAQSEHDRPSLICCHTVIGFGSPNKSGQSSAHGSPLGKKETEATKKALGWKFLPFEVSADIYQSWSMKEKGAVLEKAWQKKFNAYKKRFPKLASEWERRVKNRLPKDWAKVNKNLVKTFVKNPKEMATRQASFNVLEKLGPILPELLGGSADLTESNRTRWSGCRDLSSQQVDANYIHYGVREFGMSGIMNGLALYGGFIPYGGTFLVFYSYAASAVRMAALMKQRVIFIYSHDSIGLGADGPTHQPIEQAGSLRLTPNVVVWRPCDALETAVAWQAAIERMDGPSVLLLSRQKLIPQIRDKKQVANVHRGGYTLSIDKVSDLDIVLIATGSELELAMIAAKQLKKRGCIARVVSMPSTEVFLSQDEAYRESVLPQSIKKRIVIEAGATACWHQFTSELGCIIGLDQFGASAPAKDLNERFGFTVEHIVEVALSTFFGGKSNGNSQSGH